MPQSHITVCFSAALGGKSIEKCSEKEEKKAKTFIFCYVKSMKSRSKISSDSLATDDVSCVVTYVCEIRKILRVLRVLWKRRETRWNFPPWWRLKNRKKMLIFLEGGIHLSNFPSFHSSTVSLKHLFATLQHECVSKGQQSFEFREHK